MNPKDTGLDGMDLTNVAEDRNDERPTPHILTVLIYRRPYLTSATASVLK